MKTSADQFARESSTPQVRCADSSLPRVSSTALLQGQRQVVIEHAGREYRLRLTAQGKLILTA